MTVLRKLVLNAVADVVAALVNSGLENNQQPVVGASIGALRELTEGKRMDSPFLSFPVEVEIEGVVSHALVPVFCDPGLDGLKVYAIRHPKPLTNVTIIGD